MIPPEPRANEQKLGISGKRPQIRAHADDTADIGLFRLRDQTPECRCAAIMNHLRQIDGMDPPAISFAPNGCVDSGPGEEGKSPRSRWLTKNARIAWRPLSYEVFYEEALAAA